MVEETKEKKYRMQREGFKVSTNSKGEKVLNDFMTIQDHIGQGNYCKVKKAVGIFPAEPPEYPDEEIIPYAVKVYDRNTLEKQYVSTINFVREGEQAKAGGMRKLKDVIYDEIDAWSELKHPNVVKALTWFEHPSQNKMYLRMQLADLGSLQSSNTEDVENMVFNFNPKVYEFVLNKINTDAEL